MISREDDKLVLRGRLTIATVPAVFEEGLRLLGSEDMLVDFSEVEAVDSAAVSMLLGWLRAAGRSQRTLRVTGLPRDLISLADLYGVTSLLPEQAT
jgi:phospholipid transport system transporter-binding protein